MNFGQKEVEKRTKQLNSSTTHRVRTMQLITIRVFLLALIALGVITIDKLSDGYLNIFSTAPNPQEIQIFPQGGQTSIFDTSGNTVQTLVGKNANQQYVSLKDIPINLQHAFIAIEDEHFNTHNGIDIPCFLRSLAAGLKKDTPITFETTTITQQLVKNQIFRGGEGNTFFKKLKRSLQEQYLAIQIEKKYSKDEILEYYLNTINLGQNLLGVQAASLRYFNKNVSDLTLSECTVLAGIAQNPSAYNPILHPAKNRSQRILVLSCMKNQGYIDSKQYNLALKDNVYDQIQTINKKTSRKVTINSYFTDALIQQVIQDLKEKCGYTETQACNALYTGGLRIYSTQDSNMQAVVDRITNDPKYYPKDSKYQLLYQLTIKKSDGTEHAYSFENIKDWFNISKKKHIPSYFKTKKAALKCVRQFKKAMVKAKDSVLSESIHLIIQPQVSFVLMDQKTGNVKALCGGRGEKNEVKTLNRATTFVRQPGSAFPTLSTYLPALDTAGKTLASVQDDAPFYYPGTKRLVRNWYNSSYRGLSSLRTAMTDSIHVVAVKTMNEITPKVGYDYLLNLGFTTLVNNHSTTSGNPYTDIDLPLASGELAKGVTNLELTTAYATLANQGVYQRASFYTKVLDSEGNVILDHTVQSESEKRTVIKDSTAWLLTSSLQDAIQKGTGIRARFKKSKMPQAGKTGFSTDKRDVWFIGYTPYLTAGIWGGYDENQKQKSTYYHEDIWRDIMEELNANYTNAIFSKPPSIASEIICTKCGKLAIDGLCNKAIGGSCTQTEYFAKDTVPSETCDCHIQCQICKASGHLAGEGCPEKDVYSTVYLQKNESAHTSDSPLIIPRYLAGSNCEVHN